MNKNDDFSKLVLLHANEIPWEDSPMPGVERRRLDRVNNNGIDRVTTIVRYAANSHFSAHTHSGGEEFIVLDGVFQDEYGDWPEGSYVRNPPTSKHTPGSDKGCTIFVKLQQFDPADRTFVHINFNRIGAIPHAARPAVSVTPLFQDATERVQFERWEAHARVEFNTLHGVELLLLKGSASFTAQGTAPVSLSKHSWLRMPANAKGYFDAGESGTSVWCKEFTKPLQV